MSIIKTRAQITGHFLVCSDGTEIAISREDIQMVIRHSWRIGKNGYIYRRGGRTKGVPCLLHRIIVDAKPSQEIHHRNGNRLDNRRENLEITTASRHQEHHKHLLIARNKASRIYPKTGICKECGTVYTKDRDHRGRQKCCSKRCAITIARRIYLEKHHVVK